MSKELTPLGAEGNFGVLDMGVVNGHKRTMRGIGTEIDGVEVAIVTFPLTIRPQCDFDLQFNLTDKEILDTATLTLASPRLYNELKRIIKMHDESEFSLEDSFTEAIDGAREFIDYIEEIKHEPLG